METDVRFRHELKYLINKRDMDSCIARLSMFAGRDSHAGPDGYFIRSLYFDDIYHSAYEDKAGGVAKRAKYRIRMYDMDKSFISLEEKIKEGPYIRKESVRLTEDEYDKILRGDTDFLLGRQEPAADDFSLECRLNALRPEVIVDYDRVPFVYEHGNVRITFDMNIRASSPGDIFEKDLPGYEVLGTDLLIMEVKYTQFLPDILRVILPDESCRIAASKFVMCMDALRRIMVK